MAMYPVGRVEGERVYFDNDTNEFVKRRPDGVRVRIPVPRRDNIGDHDARKLFRDLYQTIAHA